MLTPHDDTRIGAMRPLLSPAILIEEIPLTDKATSVIDQGRAESEAILRGDDDRLIVVVGPCSIHDTKAAMEYAQRLLPYAEKYKADLQIIMRVYFEKPRTVVGWKGLINDPKIDGSFEINNGLRIGRQLLVDICELGLPTGAEFLDTIIPQFIADAIAWSAIGARTTESQVHRELASGLSMPVGFKNGTSGNVQIAIDAVRSAAQPHWFPSVTKQGVTAIFQTTGNPSAHVILRGGNRTGPNYEAKDIEPILEELEAVKLPPYLIVDCSHGNSNKDYTRQSEVAHVLAEQIAAGQKGIAGIMLESHLVAGRQDYKEGGENTYGQSITDGCIDFEATEAIFQELAQAVQARRG
ncbi:MAG: 3-deoxy-7-phosphoheptulonate synthase [Opitutales bacterium]|jgi:3-deoxy-7-phosphoheptulonate synthase|nr:3-deoxy-7-phosphoheptulonate synthase [Opitutales bacterium]MDP4643645.1 3-deoxy-7-phosphoheptulonate synthase [Opitutales bacterium]MDP4776805.1 3-deoxy-7-phosphoheptulonate synthase [Opitutales bacterium]MDP4884578.1 3-deoxy-7-phosphoheptulonate synthase [Opitutales bacterium]MDP5079572.1 3-deoxy-7-phosphoheptulonate synthase [Opitutales bacterium]